MHRRKFVRALAAVPAVPALFGQQPGTAQTGPAQPAPGIPLNPTQGVQPPPAASRELPKLETSVPDEAAEGMPRFFTPEQFAALARLSDILMPSENGRPGALSAKAPQFLDFLVGESPADRKEVYRSGLDALNSQAKKRFAKQFSELQTPQAQELLAPLNEPWTYEPPKEPVARFLRVAKVEVRTATVNSREYIKGSGAGAGERRQGGGGLYWYPLD